MATEPRNAKHCCPRAAATLPLPATNSHAPSPRGRGSPATTCAPAAPLAPSHLLATTTCLRLSTVYVAGALWIENKEKSRVS
ncbi:hypothetical protein E2562_038766 [Oryza meyeriana var. granulata]|uniref:Uncharacterized protein n=1 Tax=Oryza meyeriana var. granulata TaxID=110450 RepID=A0A6G1FGP6_9ORYZ|nr:hypothetical protein E2562_038766 [Oryza meyeriana var. granulata]